MKRIDVRNLAPGDEVLWTDPDPDGLGSRVYKIAKVEILYQDSDDECVVRIQDVRGDVLETWSSELS